ncbi:MAG TPA: hypothetical protein VFD06_12790 [Candidatus Polarisedimenticolia bacterium]|nr:hypothetical protein [Candidatus Polarisedimenticolia bacterium]
MEWHVRLAYIDPVSGSILIQTLVAAVAGGAAFFRKSLWALIKRPAAPLSSPGPTPPTATPAEKEPKVS